MASLHKLSMLILCPLALIYFEVYVSTLRLINCSILALFNGRARATRGHSRPEVTSTHTFRGSVIISRPAAWGLHKNEIGHLNLRSSWPSFFLRYF